MATQRLPSARRIACKAHLLTHIEASNPCTFKSVLQWAQWQGVAAGFVQNMQEMHRAGIISYTVETLDGETRQIVELGPNWGETK